jgi:hypothetical protein
MIISFVVIIESNIVSKQISFVNLVKYPAVHLAVTLSLVTFLLIPYDLLSLFVLLGILLGILGILGILLATL